MPLPTLVVPEYECSLPSGQIVKYRPFLVREEKLLYIAMESGDQKEMIKAVKEIIKNCTSVKKVDNLATFEIEYLFLQRKFQYLTTMSFDLILLLFSYFSK